MGSTAVAARLAVALASMALLGGCSAGGSPSPSPSLDHPTASPSATLDPMAGWRAVPDQPALRGMALTALGRAEQRFVAVGIAAGRVVVLDSEDGLTWHRGADLGFPIVWWSLDGRSWETIPAGSIPDGFDPVVVAASQTVEVAAGSRGAMVPAWWPPVP